MKNKADNYILNLAQATSIWSAPNAKLLKSPVWNEQWALASNMGRDSLAHGWLACWIESMNGMTQSQTRVHIHRTMIVYREWFRTIHAHIRKDALDELGFPAAYDKLPTLLTTPAKPDPDLNALKTLWFGSDHERLAALTILPQTKFFAGTYGALVPALAWDVARLPSATALHRAVAAVLSVEYGRSGQTSDYVPHIDATDKMWRDLGEVADAYAENVGYDRLGAMYYDEITMLPPSEASLPLLHLLDAALYNSGKPAGMRVGRKTVIGSQSPEVAPFMALRKWMPQRKSAFDVAEATGMTYQETLGLISHESAPQPSHLVMLPTQLDSDYNP